jgi:hypothetical protein
VHNAALFNAGIIIGEAKPSPSDFRPGDQESLWRFNELERPLDLSPVKPEPDQAPTAYNSVGRECHSLAAQC